jgi:pimeloyl-ACP methyl ester carboxylesterase
MPRLDVETKTLRTPDGTHIVLYDTTGDKPPVVLANGLGGPFGTWRYQVEYLRERYRLVSWDYRGLSAASRPPGDPPRLDMASHVADLQAVLAETGIERAAFIGWSMGAQVLIELFDRAPERITHLVFVNGTFGRPFETVAVPLATRIIPRLVRQVQRHHRVGSKLLQRATRWPETLLWLKRLGLIGSTVDAELFREMAADFSELDLELYLRLLRSLGDHDAARVLPQINVPTLVIAGERDAFTPRPIAERMAMRIPDSELLMVRGATHYTAVEYPELVNLRIEKFFREHDYG